MQNHATSADWRWPLWGAAAGIFGYVGHLLTVANVSNDERRSGAAVIDHLDRTNYHIGIVAGMAAVFSLLAFAAGWRRFASATFPNSLAGSIVSLALVASSGAMILGYGIKGAIAVYLPGGLDEGMYPKENLLPLFMFDDLGPFMAWYGVAMAAAAIAWLALREHQLPFWLGGLSALFALVPAGYLVATGLPGFPGVIDPFWLVVLGVTLAVTFRRTAHQSSGQRVEASSPLLAPAPSA